jgi:formate dehydrogenase iron-sulfur subunit
MAGYFFFIDTTRCTACRGCQVACKAWHKLPGTKTRQWGSPQNPADLDSNTYRLVRFREYEKKGQTVRYYFPDACRHCLDPYCRQVADEYVEGAVIIDRTGAVIFTEKTRELGAHAEDVIDACPFFVPRLDPETGLLKKCDMCLDRVKAGLEPVCAKTCPTGAIKFGNEKTIVGLAKKRLAEINRKQGNTATLINADAVRVIYLVTADPDDYYEYSSY